MSGFFGVKISDKHSGCSFVPTSASRGQKALIAAMIVGLAVAIIGSLALGGVIKSLPCTTAGAMVGAGAIATLASFILYGIRVKQGNNYGLEVNL